ncbi:MAG TPA: type II toxin-antitoxin system Phd/YefM family antitoxin [Terriglobales bacterium]
MKKMAAAEFKAQCLAVMDEVSKTREPVLVTKRGRPVVKLVPAERPAGSFLGRLQGVMEIVGDIESPIEPPEAWDALR